MWRKLSFIAIAVMVVVPLLPRFAQALTISPLLVEYDVNPGEAVVGTIKLINEGTTSDTFYSGVQDFVASDTSGAPAFVGVSQTHSMVSWVSFSHTSVTLDPGEQMNVTYNIRVPSAASPGSYSSGLLFSTESPSMMTSGVGFGASVGTLVLVRVEGNVVEDGNISRFLATPDSSSSLPISFAATFSNSGTVHVKPQGFIRITNMFGGTSAVIPLNAEGGNVLPASSRTFTSDWSKADLPENASELVKEWRNFGFGPYTATVIMNYGDGHKVASESTSFWVMPWMLIVLFIILLVILALLLMQYNRWVVTQASKKR